MAKNRIKKDTPLRFIVRLENELEAITHFKERGLVPIKIEKGKDGLAVFLFATPPDNQMFEFTQSLPSHLSAKVGIIIGNREPL